MEPQRAQALGDRKRDRGSGEVAVERYGFLALTEQDALERDDLARRQSTRRSAERHGRRQRQVAALVGVERVDDPQGAGHEQLPQVGERLALLAQVVRPRGDGADFSAVGIDRSRDVV